MSAQYWPGRDYPDREVWLKRRTTDLRKRVGRTISEPGKRLDLGLNVLKRRMDAAGAATGVTRPRQALVRARHAYYRRDDAKDITAAPADGTGSSG